MLDSGEAAKNREIQPEATFDLISNPGSERGNSNPRMQIAVISNVMFGIQVGLYSFSLDSETLKLALHRAVHFYELADELYWFRSPNGIPEPGKGVAGMFIYGTTTFLPTLVILASTIVWTLTIPLRVVLQLPKSKPYRIIMGELSAFIVCTIISALLDIRIQSIYSFFITI
jgi:hypothetical protein